MGHNTFKSMGRVLCVVRGYRLMCSVVITSETPMQIILRQC